MHDKIKALAKNYADEFISVRRHLHQNPELSYKEFETSKFIQNYLAQLGISFQVMGTTGVIGLIQGKNPTSRVIALRADMDALPILEENNIDYKSKNEGIMHACGHDVHTSCLLGAAKILDELKNEWEGTVKLIFQPGEEKNPGGASILIKEGVLENPAVQAIFGLHVHPSLEVGKLSFRTGKVMASADELYMTIKGVGGHAAAPHLCIDPILIASHLIIALQQLVSRRNNPQNPTVLSITAFNGGNTTNVIPSEIKLKGTFRALNETWRFEAHQLIKQLVENLVTGMGGTVDLLIDVGYPCVFNNETLTGNAKTLAETLWGAENIGETEVRMGAEDFGYYTQKIPGCFYRLGTMNQAMGLTYGVHHSKFNIDEAAIEMGIATMAWLGAAG